MNSMNLKFGDVTVRGSPTCSDCHYVKKIIFSLDYYFLSMFSIFVVLFNIVCHLLMSCHNFSLFIRVPGILFYGDLLALRTHHYEPNSMNSLNSMKELWKNRLLWLMTDITRLWGRRKETDLIILFLISKQEKLKSVVASAPFFDLGRFVPENVTLWTPPLVAMEPAPEARVTRYTALFL